VQVAERNRPKVERIRTWLVRMLQHNALPAVDRALAGNALADIGDPRFRADAWFLPYEPLLGFVEIPPGGCWIGVRNATGWLMTAKNPGTGSRCHAIT
jgi:hypothetical protein